MAMLRHTFEVLYGNIFRAPFIHRVINTGIILSYIKSYLFLKIETALTEPVPSRLVFYCNSCLSCIAVRNGWSRWMHRVSYKSLFQANYTLFFHNSAMNIDKHPFTVLIVLCFKQDRRNHIDLVVQCRNNYLSIVFPNNSALVIDCIY